MDGLAQNAALAELAENPTSLFMLAIDAPAGDVPSAADGTPIDGGTGVQSSTVMLSPSPSPAPVPQASHDGELHAQSQVQQAPGVQHSRDASDALPPSTTAAAAQTFVFALPPVMEVNPVAAETLADLEEPSATAYQSFTSGAQRLRSVSQQRPSSAVDSKHSNRLEEPSPIDGDDVGAPLLAPSHRSSRRASAVQRLCVC